MDEKEFIEFLLQQIMGCQMGDEPDFHKIGDICVELNIDLEEIWSY